jgi:hypothetical protein
MKKFVKVALLEQKQRLDAQEIQLEEVRTNKTYNSLSDGLAKFHKVNENHIEKQLEKNRTGSYDEFFENLLDEAGLYSRKNNKNDKPLGFMVDHTTKGVVETFIEQQLDKKRSE